MVSDWGEVVTRYPYGNVRMDHLLSKETIIVVLSSLSHDAHGPWKLYSRSENKQEKETNSKYFLLELAVKVLKD